MKIQSPWFMAVIDARPYDREGFRYSVCFINQSDHPIKDMSYTTTAHVDAAGMLLPVPPVKREIGDLKPFHVAEIEQVHEHGFTAEIRYYFTIEDAQGSHSVSFTIPKQLHGAVHSIDELPVVCQWGHFFLPTGK